MRAAAQAGLARRLRAEHRLHAPGVEPGALALELERLAAEVLETAVELGGRTDHAEAAEAVAHDVGHGALDARVVGDLLVGRPGQVPGRGVQVEHRVEHDLDRAAGWADHGVEAQGRPDEGALGLLRDLEHRHDEPPAQSERERGDDGGERVLAQAPGDDAQQHGPGC